MKEKKYLIYGITIVLLTIIGVTLAYFITEIEGNKKDITLNTGDLRVIFNNGEKIEGIDIEPGWSITKTFSIENKSKQEYKYNIVIQDLVNTFVSDNLVYKITSTNNGHNMTDYEILPKSDTAEDTILTYSTTISGRTKQEYTIEVKFKEEDRNQYEDMGKSIIGRIYIEKGTTNVPTLVKAMLRDNPTISERTTFDSPYTDNVSGTLFTSTESIVGSTPVNVYYYAGSTANNWVKFGGFYWRIIRTNHDGSVRLLYQGLNANETSPKIGDSAFNTIDNDPMYAGYMYGTTGSLESNRTNENDSTIKTYIDTWYENNLLTNYDKYISKSAIYCNDRSIGYGTYSVSSSFNYGGITRLLSSTKNPSKPTYNCDNIEDAFSVENVSAKLKYPIALMTGDEVVFAGGVYGKMIANSAYVWFMNKDNEFEFITMTPNAFEEGLWTDGLAVKIMHWCGSFLVNGEGVGSTKTASDNYSVRPVISLSSCVKVTGTGTADDPYVVDETNSTC